MAFIQVIDYTAATKAANQGSLVVATHGGPFHADDVAAVAVLSLLRSLRDSGAVALVRTRDPVGLATIMVQAAPIALGGFDSRKQLPAAWAGLRDDALASVTGVTDAVFCHNGRFIAEAKSREGALRLARLAVEA